ncbi:putative ester cyclase [Thermocatellispora tengchongensis]|uniref:Putative ester cyclase n=1 Tax=Thermocatellispora tengchongensis TaxID=1073253 RepID=A0A840PLL0_9ACTN|nr:ester cyclase [Thermocatellispora tengchongensis]MBB5138863.1 putative ester cyclase [Thermocatellispora tengchongensis]
MSATDINRAVARRFYDEVVSQGKLEVLDEIVADDAHDHATPSGSGLRSGRAGFVEHVTWLRGAVEGVTATVTDTVAEGDRVVVYWTIDGVQRGEVFGVPPTGRRFTGQSISTITFRDGRIVDYAVLPDRLGIVAQLTA